MKLSLAWIFDHIAYNLNSFKELDINSLVDQFTLKSAEIESVDPVNLDLINISIVKLSKINFELNQIITESLEWGKKITLPLRPEINSTNINSDEQYLVVRDNKNYRWAKFTDFGSYKESLFPSVYVFDHLLAGNWKELLSLDAQDYLLTIDNKSLTHRPDLWSHRGIAREMAALLGKNLKPEENFLSSKPIKHYPNSSLVSSTNPFKIELNSCGEKRVCKRFAGLYIPQIKNRASDFMMALRLAKVDSKPINALVDSTNYVMFDIGQPIHVFDSEKLESKNIITRCAKPGESLALLDGQSVDLSPQDYIVADGDKPISLAGIMGGSYTGVSMETTQLFVEAANFDASAIRATSMHLKIRTESSSRFEKGLDPNQNTYGLLRFIKILTNLSLEYQSSDSIASLGLLENEITITLDQSFIDSKIGSHISSNKIENILKAVGFGVLINNTDKNIIYGITVPTYRTRDIKLPEDIVEEIARFVGYSALNFELPSRLMSYFNTDTVMRLRSIKRDLAYGLNMHEVQNYAFYDEDFLKVLKYNPDNSLALLNPLSQVYKRLVSSLIPNILKNVYNNYLKEANLCFFEHNSVWTPEEYKQLAGIFYSNKQKIDFYEHKKKLSSLFNMLKLNNNISFKKPELSQSSLYLYDETQVAEIYYGEQSIGFCGKINQYLLKNLISLGDAFIFELNGDFLVNYNSKINKFELLNKYQDVSLDISMFAPYNITVSDIEAIVKSGDIKIEQVELIDYFEKPEWIKERSITVRFIISSREKTLIKAEIDQVLDSVTNNLRALGVTIR